MATAKNNARPVDPNVDPRLKQVNEVQQKNIGLKTEVTSVKGCCCLSRYFVGRKVCKTAEAMKQIREDRSANKAVFHDRPVPTSLVPDIPGRVMHKFESRKKIEEKIMAALRGRQVKIVGICGMGGVGKTILAKNIMNRVREEKLFDKCVMVCISQHVEKDKIQDKIAENLGLKLEQNSQYARASVLRSRLTNRKRILIVVDDIWQYLDAEGLGIKGCSVLLTSRNRHVLREMDAKMICEMETLREEEALSFFQEKLGFREDDQNCHSRLTEIAKECKGLPLALECVAGVLKDHQSNKYKLEDVLQQLKNAYPTDLPEFLKHVYLPLRLNYDHLPSENAKSIFLLCCLLPEYYDIPLEDLTAYAMGLRMFEGISDLEQTRNITYSIVDDLKTRLLLEGRDEWHVKMHDINRDVAIHIASTEKHFIKCSGNSTWMSPYLGERNELSKGSPFPKLRLLLVDNSADDSGISFEGMNELNVLSIRNNNDSLSSIPQFQTNLRTLIFEDCAMESMCGVEGLENLEILICRECHNIKELPLEMKRLERLILLKISHCGDLKKIRKGVLSSLRKLEELEIVESFNEWEAEDNVCLSELECLFNLTCLNIEVKDFNLAAQQISLSPKIKKYDIKVGDVPAYLWYDIEVRKFTRVMRVHLPVDITLGKWMQNAECLYLDGNVSNCLDLGKAQHIKHLRLQNCSTISSIAFTHLLESIQLNCLDNLEEIDTPNYTNLSCIKVYRCNRLLNLSIVKDCFPQLKHLEISFCDMMEKVFDENEKNIDIGHGSQHATAITTFPELKTLRLYNLPRLKVFYQGIESIEFPLPTDIYISQGVHSLILYNYFASKRMLFYGCVQNLEHYLFMLVSMFDNLRETAPLSNQILIGSFTQLTNLQIEDLGKLKSLFSFSMAQNLHRLTWLCIGRCTEMVQVIEVNDEECSLHETKVLFPHLENLFLIDLPKLKSFCKWRRGLNEDQNGKKIIGQSSRADMAFPRLEGMFLRDLPELINLYEGFESTDMPLLTHMELISCPKLKGHFSTTTSGETKNRHVLSIMDAMETLREEEALSFFHERLGFREDDQNCSSRLAEIAKECKYLPLALECVAGVLKHQKSHLFMLEDVLQQLKNSSPEDLPQVLEDVYNPLKLNYDHLPSENAKSIFLMCCLLPQDHNIPLEVLNAYAMGLRMFEGISDLEQTRTKTYSIILDLKARFLLMEGQDEWYVKMHDVIRDVAIHIASKEKHFIKCGDSSTWMSPYLGQSNELSKGSPFPKLRLLLVDNSADEEELLGNGISFEGMNELNVLSIRHNNDSLISIPQFQANLRTLIFEDCAMESMRGVGGLVNLEILICRGCDNIKELPLEMAGLEHLRLLGISKCPALQKIRKGVLSSLKKLEELEIVKSFIIRI